METPKFYFLESNLFHTIAILTKEKPNDMELGKAVRTIIQDYHDGKYNPPLETTSHNKFEGPIKL